MHLIAARCIMLLHLLLVLVMILHLALIHLHLCILLFHLLALSVIPIGIVIVENRLPCSGAFITGTDVLVYRNLVVGVHGTLLLKFKCLKLLLGRRRHNSCWALQKVIILLLPVFSVFLFIRIRLSVGLRPLFHCLLFSNLIIVLS